MAIALAICSSPPWPAVTGSFERAILEASRVLAVQGRILPSTLEM
jgi:hypothetical protein